MKKRIGIVPKSYSGDSEQNCMMDHYRLGNNYIKRIVEAGCVPIGIAPSDNLLDEEVLALCDGFLVQGGSEFYPYHFQVIHHAVTHGKRYLGICLGNQLIYTYFALKRMVENEGYEGDTVKAICDYRVKHPTDRMVLKKIPGHRYEVPPRGREDEAKHEVKIVPGTLLHRVLGQDTMRICSFHNYCTPEDQNLITVNAWSAKGDLVVEGVEYGDHILGVQGHPELDGLLPKLFDFLAE